MSYRPPEGKKKGGFKREKGTGEYIRDYLMEQGVAYVQEIYKEFKKWCQERGYTPPSYGGFRSYFWVLKKLDLVEFVGDKESDFGEPRRYYQIKGGAEGDDAWKWPHKAWEGRE